MRIESVWHDTRSAWGALLHSRGFAIWVILSLAIGMSVTIAALALLNALLVLPFPAVTDQAHLVRVSVSRNCGRPDCWIRMSSADDYAGLREGLTGLEGLAAHTGGEIAASLPDARAMRATFASANYFEVLGVRPVHGRAFDRSDADANASVAVIAHSVWAQQFGSDPSVIGRSMRVANEFVHIIGVAPEFFIGVDRIRPGGRAPDVWLPLGLTERVLPLTPAEQRRQERDIYFIGRLKAGKDVSELLAEADVVARRLAATRSQSSSGAMAEAGRVWRVDPKSWHFGILVVMPIPLLVLAIACVNAANLMLARGSQRQREIAVRLAIGAGRSRIIRQLLIESALLGIVSTAIALTFAWWGLQLMSDPLGAPIPLDRTVLTLTVLTALATTVASGLAPAIRISAQQPSTTLGSAGGRGDATPRQSRMRRALVGAQVTLSIGLLATAWQLVSTVRSQAVSAGTPPDRLLIARFDLRPFKLPAHEVDLFYRQLLDGASRLAGVEAVGLGRHTAVWTFGRGAGPGSIVVWRPTDNRNEGNVVIGGYAGGNLFEAIGLRVTAGRGFSEADRQPQPSVAIVNDSAAKLLNQPAVGSTLRVAPRSGDFASSIEVRIVGIIESPVEPRYNPDGQPAAKVYLPSPIDAEPALALYLRTRDRTAVSAQPLRELVNRIAPHIPITELGSLEEINERSYGYGLQLWLARAATVLGILGVLLATAGLYSVSSCRRTSLPCARASWRFAWR
ncbi:MAG: ABC transporter permease [Vicinamibacterales bacterium]